MLYLILGLLLWSGAHLFGRILPRQRQALGMPGKGLVALGVLAGLVLMVIGYRAADPGTIYWGRHPATTGIADLLMLFAVYLFAVSGLRTGLARVIRHPQLTAVKTWAVAHLLVNGDLPSFVLFGGLLAWAVVSVIVINRAEPRKVLPPAPRHREIAAVIATLVVYALIAWLHGWLGYDPFG
ncbi:NnrU family protein [Pontibaca methylaminivorans]|uniref:NnrU family protein n=1 Tax=Pontibaca methylaminivorans TaxID=515897 RepID=UPI002FDA3A02